MARPQNPDLTKYWKICLPATLAGIVELYLFDRLHGKPKYGSRAALLNRLLSDWVAEQKDPDARLNAVLREISAVNMGPFVREEMIDAIRRGLETELAPSTNSPIPETVPLSSLI